MPSILFLGASGYIGSAVFSTFVNAHPAFEYVALLRSPAHTAHIKDVRVVKGSLDDRAIVAELAVQADVVVNVARSGDVGLVDAIAVGMRKRREEAKRPGALIHTCGMDVFGELVEGGPVWDDTDEASVNALLSGPVERAILAAEAQGLLDAYFICPATVYGISPGPSGKVSPFYTHRIRAALARSSPTSSVSDAGVTGMVDINDLALLYRLVLNSILRPLLSPSHSPPLSSPPPVPSFCPSLSSSPVPVWATPPSPTSDRTDPLPRCYIASTHERTWSHVSALISRILVARGVLPAPPSEPRFDDVTSSSNSDPDSEITTAYVRLRARRAYSELGWAPADPARAWEDAATLDVERALVLLGVGVAKK